MYSISHPIRKPIHIGSKGTVGFTQCNCWIHYVTPAINKNTTWDPEIKWGISEDTKESVEFQKENSKRSASQSGSFSDRHSCPQVALAHESNGPKCEIGPRFAPPPTWARARESLYATHSCTFTIALHYINMLAFPYFSNVGQAF